MEQNPLEKLDLYERIFESTVPDYWALVNIAGMPEKDANNLITEREQYLLKLAKSRYKLAQLEYTGQ